MSGPGSLDWPHHSPFPEATAWPFVCRTELLGGWCFLRQALEVCGEGLSAEPSAGAPAVPSVGGPRPPDGRHSLQSRGGSSYLEVITAALVAVPQPPALRQVRVMGFF